MKLHTQALNFLVSNCGFTLAPYKDVAKEIAKRSDVLLDDNIDLSDKKEAKALVVAFAKKNGLFCGMRL